MRKKKKKGEQTQQISCQQIMKAAGVMLVKHCWSELRRVKQ